MDQGLKSRLDIIEKDAKQKLKELKENQKIPRTHEFYKKTVNIKEEPIFIASTVDIGTHRVRANHIDAFVHFYEEQERLKKENAPI